MNISRENYEVFILDYFEGALSENEVEELLNFLEKNPDLKEEFERFEIISIDSDIDFRLFPDKENLKMSEVITVGSINHENYIENFIACHEGDLDEQKQNEILKFLECNPELKDEFELFSEVKLHPDVSVQYQLKESLKQKVTISFPLMFMRYAAALATLFGIGFATFFGLNYLQTSEDGYMAFSSNRKGINDVNPVSNQKENEIIIVTPTHYYNNINLIKEIKRVPENAEFQILHSTQTSKLPLDNLNNHHNEVNMKRTEFAEIYSYRNEKLQMYGVDENNYANIEEPRLFEKVVNTVRENTENATDKMSNISGWQIAEYGVRGFNLLTDNDVDFRVKSNEHGDVTKVALNNFAIPVKRDR